MHRSILFVLAAGALVAAPAIPEAHQGIADHARRTLHGQAFQLGLDNDHDFRVKSTQYDGVLDEVDVRVHQHYKGVRVLEGAAILHMLGGRQRAATDGLVRGLRLNTTPALLASEALAVAHGHLAPKGGYAAAPTSELVIASVNGRNQLVYHVHTELENGAAETAHTDFLIDAQSGKVLESWDTLHTANATGTGRSQYSGMVNVATNSTATGFEFRDTTRSTAGNAIYNLNHATTGTGTIYTDADNSWGDAANYVEGSATTAANGQTAAVDAAYGTQTTWDMFKNVFGRNGIDGNGTATYSRVHYSNSYDNAFWSDTCFCMTYGDGSSFSTLTALDVAGHEMSHGVCARTANLAYKGESGGLNEANSDIFGTLAEFYARGAGAAGTTIPDTGGNYNIGEQLAAKPLRYMAKPSTDGKSPDFWSKSLTRLDVHYSSGVANHFFYLLSHGATSTTVSPMTNSVTSVAGIGNHKAGQIWFRALTKYMTATTNYAAARTATLKAATDLYGAASTEYATVNKAWLAVNVK